MKAAPLWDELSGLKPRRLTAWLLLAVRYRSLDILDKEERSTPMQEDALELLLKQPLPEASPEDMLRYFKALPQKYGAVLLLQYIFFYSSLYFAVG